LLREISGPGTKVLDLADDVRLDRRWSAAEVERARAMRSARRIGDAVTMPTGTASQSSSPQVLSCWRRGETCGHPPTGTRAVRRWLPRR